MVGLYMHPPENAIVLCVDEKTRVQALDRTQPLLPMRPGQIERRTHDYKSNGTVQLFAALEVHAGRVVSRIEERHRSREFIAFMSDLLRAYPTGELHIILDNVSTHDSKEVKEWHRKPRYKRVVFHLIPIYSSWLNLAELLFPIKRDLVTAIMNYIQKFNDERRVFRWTKTAEAIINSVINLTGH